MFKADDLKKLEASLGLKEGEFKTLYEDKEEKPLAVDTFEIIPKADYTTRIANIEKQKYAEGKTAGEEIRMKEIRTEFGVDVSKKIDVKELKTVISTKILEEAKIEPDKKVKQLEADVEVMRTNWETEKKAKLEIETNYKQKETTRTINSNVISLLPKKTIIPIEEVAQLSLGKASQDGIVPAIGDDGISIVFKKGDQVLKDVNLVPLKADEVLKPYYGNYVQKATGGDGGGDSTEQAKAGTFQAFAEEMKEKNITENSQKYNEEMRERMKAGTLKM